MKASSFDDSVGLKIKFNTSEGIMVLLSVIKGLKKIWNPFSSKCLENWLIFWVSRLEGVIIGLLPRPRNTSATVIVVKIDSLKEAFLKKFTFLVWINQEISRRKIVGRRPCILIGWAIRAKKKKKADKIIFLGFDLETKK